MESIEVGIDNVNMARWGCSGVLVSRAVKVSMLLWGRCGKERDTAEGHRVHV